VIGEQMRRISDAVKESIIKKAIGKKGAMIEAIAKENNVGFSSIKKWMKEYQFEQLNQGNTRHKSISRTMRLQHVFATASLEEDAIGVYCRERGLYAAQINAWKDAIMKESDEQKSEALLNELKKLRLENKRLKEDLNRKDRVLAETTALLVLKKKASAIWGEHEDD
jgi:transposase